MTPERRKELVQRREQLKEQRQREWLEPQRQSFLASLDTAKVIYLIADDELLVDWITKHFTVDQWSSIDWSNVKQRRYLASEVFAPPALLVDLAEVERLDDPDIAIVYADPARPSLKMRYSELAKHAEWVLDLNWQTWAFDPASDWIIEFHHDLGWNWGRAA